MEDYLKFTRTSLTDLSCFQKIHGILGNEACDLDSAVATLVYGYYLYSVHSSDESTLFLPILNIPREQFRLRTETVHFLSKVNLSHDLLTFRNEVDLLNWHNEGKLILSLVDHNVLPAKDAILEDAVVTVIDHRHQERPDSDRTEVILDLVGSCCTLVAEQLLQHPFFDMDDQTATLLYGTILVDTVNRSPEAGKTTPKDGEILDELARKLPDVSAQELFDELQEAKCNIIGLSNEEIFLKDLKKIGNTNMTIAMCSMCMDLQTLLDREHFVDDLKAFCAAQGAEVAVLMTLSSSGSSVQRQLAVYSENRIFRQQIADLLDTSLSPNLQLEPLASPAESLLCFSQGNVKGSRKKVIPILKSFLTGEETPGMDVSGFPFEGLESETIGSDVPLTNIKDSFSQEVPEGITQDNNDDPFGLFSGGGEASSENHFSSSNPFADDFLSNCNSNWSPKQQQASDEFDPFSVTSFESNPDDKKESGRNPMDSFIDSLLSGNNPGVAPAHSAEATDSAKVEGGSDLESSLELSTEVKSAGSSYPVTPPNSYMESDMERYAKEHNLPSFNNSEMVKIIRDRQASMDKDVIPEEQGEEGDMFPYTPRNSYQESPMESADKHHELPSFQSEEILQRIMDKRASLGGEVDGLDSGSNRSSSDRSFPAGESAQQIENTVAFGLAQDIKGSNPFGTAESGQPLRADNVVAQNLAQEMTDADPFSLGIQQMPGWTQNLGKVDDDPFSLGLIANAGTEPREMPSGDTTDSDPFGFQTVNDANQENALAASITEEMKSSNPFSNENEMDRAENDSPEPLAGVVRERSVENFQDFLPEVERNVISPDRSPKHSALSDGAASSQQEASNLSEIFDYGDVDSNLKSSLHQHNKEAMAQEIIRQNLEEAQRKASEQMTGIVTQQPSVDISPDSDHDLDELVGGNAVPLTGLENPAFGSSEESDGHGSLIEDIAVTSDKADEANCEDIEDIILKDNVVAARIAEDMKNPAFGPGEGEEDYSALMEDNVVASNLAAEMKSSSKDGGELEYNSLGYLEDSENVVASNIAAEMKSSSSNDIMSNDNIVAAGIASDMRSDQEKEKSKNTFSRMDSQYLLENENMMAGLIASDMKAELFSDKDREGFDDEKKKSKGVNFSESLSSSSDSENLDTSDNSFGYDAMGGKGEELAVAQKFAEEIISEACEIVAKDERSGSESGMGLASKGLSRREMALKMMEADEFDSEEESDKDKSEDEPGHSEEERDDYVVEDGLEGEEGESVQYSLENTGRIPQMSAYEQENEEPGDEANSPQEPAGSDQDKAGRLHERSGNGQLEDDPQDPESELSVARRITDTVLSEALGHVSREQEDSAIAEKLAEAMRESSSGEDSDELEKRQKRTRFADEFGVGGADSNVNNSESVDNKEQVALARESHSKGHIDNKWDKMDGFKKDSQIVEGNGNKVDSVINTSNTRLDAAAVSPNSEEAVREVAFDMAADIIQKALDTFPVEEPVEEHEDSSSSPPSSDISPNSENYPPPEGHSEMKRSHEMCPIAPKDDRTNQELALPLETEYLPNVDPLRGSLDLVTSPVQKLETDASKEVAEDTSFKQLSTEIYSSDTEEESEESVIEDLTASKGSSLGTSASENKASVIPGQTDTEQLTQETQAPLMSSGRSDVAEVPSQSSSQPSRITDTAVGIEQDLEQEEPSSHLDGKKRKEVYMTTAGRISIATDYQAESDDDQQMALTEDSIAEESRHQLKEDVTDEEFLYNKTKQDLAEAIADTDTPEFQYEMVEDSVESRVVPIETEVRLRQDSESSDTISKSDDTPVVSPAAEAIPEYTAEEESDDQKNWRKVTIGDQQFTIDMKVVEPYKRVLSHGGYYGEGLNAMIVFSGCYLPDRSRKDYSYVMENLFFYVISTLELLVAEDYMIVYFHGATPRRQMPSFSWLKRCYQMIDRRLKKNLKGLLLVHPTLWIKTIIMMSRPFISSKFSSKLRLVKTLAELETLVPMEYVFVPDQVKEYDERRQKSSSVSTPSTPSSAAVSPR